MSGERGIRLSDFASRIKLDRSSTDQATGELVIVNGNLDRLAANGWLSIGQESGAGPSGGDSGRKKSARRAKTTQGSDKRRSYWRKRFIRQRDLVEEQSTELARLDTKVDSLTDAWEFKHDPKLALKLEQAKRNRREVQKNLQRERGQLQRIIREARQDGPQPSWFR